MRKHEPVGRVKLTIGPHEYDIEIGAYPNLLFLTNSLAEQETKGNREDILRDAALLISDVTELT